jgi:hypothetical protein
MICTCTLPSLLGSNSSSEEGVAQRLLALSHHQPTNQLTCPRRVSLPLVTFPVSRPQLFNLPRNYLSSGCHKDTSRALSLGGSTKGATLAVYVHTSLQLVAVVFQMGHYPGLLSNLSDEKGVLPNNRLLGRNH